VLGDARVPIRFVQRLGTKPRFGFGYRTERRFLPGRVVKPEGQ